MRSIIVTKCAGGPRNTAKALLTNVAVMEWCRWTWARPDLFERWDASETDEAVDDVSLRVGDLLTGWKDVVVPPIERLACMRA